MSRAVVAYTAEDELQPIPPGQKDRNQKRPINGGNCFSQIIAPLQTTQPRSRIEGQALKVHNKVTNSAV